MSKFWLEDPAVLMKQNELTKLWPSGMKSMNEKLNAITRMTIIFTLLAYAVTKKAKVVISGFVTLLAIVLLYYIKKTNMINNLRAVVKNEGFGNPNHIKEIDGGGSSCNATKPTPKNPLMNVMLHEIHENSSRKPAAKSFHPVVENEINEATKEFVSGNFDDPNIRSKLFDDLGDSFTFDRSMRAWHPTANTQIPNDQKGFADFCYGNMLSCKDGHETACMKSAPHRWMNN
tara:strand:- start:1093 stop:1785 length:693 start_codon:yes stop_codon:yes gene_type:complete